MMRTAPGTRAVNSVYLWSIAAVAALGGLLFGWDWVVIGGAKPFFQSYFHITEPAMIGWVNSCALVGCLLGAMISGVLSNRMGRRRPLLFAALLFGVTSIGNAFAQHLDTFVLWRIAGGVAIGLASSLSPLYLAEVAPAHQRGKVVSLNQLTVVVGILAAQYLNWFLVRALPPHATDEFIRTSWFGQQGWRWMFGITSIPAALFLFGMLFVPESPRWLAQHARPDEARQILARIGGSDYAAAEMAEMDRALGSARPQLRSRGLLRGRLRRVVVLGVLLAVFQQWCGINVIFNYADEIFRSAGYDISSVLSNIAWTGSINMVFTLAALGVVDRGRRPLMLMGSAALAIVYGALGLCYGCGVQGWPLLVLVLLAIACYAVSLAPVTWVVISEIFPTEIRSQAMAVAVAALWIACFVLTYTFPILNAHLGAAGTFYLYAGICALGFLYILAALPETRGKSLEQIAQELVGDN